VIDATCCSIATGMLQSTDGLPGPGLGAERLLGGGELARLRVESGQARQDFFREQRDVGDRIGMVEKAALAEHQQVAKAANRLVQRLDLCEDVIGVAGGTGAAVDQLLDRRGRLVDRVAVPIADEAASLPACFEHRHA